MEGRGGVEGGEFIRAGKAKKKTGVKPLQTGPCDGVLFGGCGASG